MTIEAALFDLDGTLVDSLEDLTDAVNHMLAEFGIAALDIGAVRKFIGKGARNLVQLALDTDSSEDIKRGLRLFTDFNTIHIADKSKLYLGVRGTLEDLKSRGILLAVISNKNESLSRLILETLGINDLFALICGGDTFSEMKPSPLPLQQVLLNLGILSDKAVMIGDSINDIQAGIQAGITTIGCTWGYGGYKELQGADHLIASCGELAPILLGLGE